MKSIGFPATTSGVARWGSGTGKTRGRYRAIRIANSRMNSRGESNGHRLKTPATTGARNSDLCRRKACIGRTRPLRRCWKDVAMVTRRPHRLEPLSQIVSVSTTSPEMSGSFAPIGLTTAGVRVADRSSEAVAAPCFPPSATRFGHRFRMAVSASSSHQLPPRLRRHHSSPLPSAFGMRRRSWRAVPPLDGKTARCGSTGRIRRSSRK